ncbi:hypothetical protein AB0P35_42050, partial [Kitasatospora sp. NPDC085879]
MSIDIPPWAMTVSKYLVGTWPAADEDGMQAAEDMHGQLARDAAVLLDTLASLSLHVPGWRGDARQAHDRGVGELLDRSGLEQTREAALSIAAGLRETRAGVVKAKIQALEIAAWLIASIAWAVATAVFTEGASLALIAAFEATAEGMLAALGRWFLALLKAIASGAVFMTVVDVAAQGIELARGDIDEINWESVGWAALTGGAAGAVGMGLGVGWAAAKGVVSKGVGGALGAAEEGAVTGAVSSGRGSVSSVLSSAAGRVEQYGHMVVTNYVTNVGMSTAQGRTNANPADAFDGAAVSALHGPAGSHGPAGRHEVAGPHGPRETHGPARLAEMLPHLVEGPQAGRFEPFAPAGDAGRGFGLSGGDRVEVTARGNLWVRPEGWGEAAGESAFATAVRNLPSGPDGAVRLVVGTADMAPGAGVERLLSTWEELRHAPDRADAMPSHVVLAAPLTEGEVSALRGFVARERVEVSAPNGQLLAGPEGTLYVPEGNQVAGSGGRGQWL